jgi:hypothetical protein
VNRHVSLLLFLAVVVATILAGCWLRMNYAPEWWPQATPQGLRPFPVEADCYSQLARVKRILHGDGLIQNHFKVENWPKGLSPSTTAPFDYVILALGTPLALFTHYPLDWAGALVFGFSSVRACFNARAGRRSSSALRSCPRWSGRRPLAGLATSRSFSGCWPLC